MRLEKHNLIYISNIFHPLIFCSAWQLSCQSAQFYDTTVSRVSPRWFLFGTDPVWSQVSLPSLDMSAVWPLIIITLQGALFYERPVTWTEVERGDVLEGVYIYPDWASCVRGAWAKHTLVQGSEVAARVSTKLCCVVLQVCSAASSRWPGWARSCGWWRPGSWPPPSSPTLHPRTTPPASTHTSPTPSRTARLVGWFFHFLHHVTSSSDCTVGAILFDNQNEGWNHL